MSADACPTLVHGCAYWPMAKASPPMEPINPYATTGSTLTHRDPLGLHSKAWADWGVLLPPTVGVALAAAGTDGIRSRCERRHPRRSRCIASLRTPEHAVHVIVSPRRARRPKVSHTGTPLNGPPASIGLSDTFVDISARAAPAISYGCERTESSGIRPQPLSLPSRNVARPGLQPQHACCERTAPDGPSAGGAE